MSSTLGFICIRSKYANFKPPSNECIVVLQAMLSEEGLSMSTSTLVSRQSAQVQRHTASPAGSISPCSAMEFSWLGKHGLIYKLPPRILDNDPLPSCCSATIRPSRHRITPCGTWTLPTAVWREHEITGVKHRPTYGSRMSTCGSGA